MAGTPPHTAPSTTAPSATTPSPGLVAPNPAMTGAGTPPELPDLGGAMPFARLLELRSTGIGDDGLTASMRWRPELCTTGGLLHGGAIMSAADSVGAATAVDRLPSGAATATISSHTSFLAGVRGGTVSVRSFVEHAGRRFITVRTEVRDEGARLVAVTMQTQAVLRAP